jgi:hypothetical protein
MTDDDRITSATVNPDGSGYEVKTIPDPTLNLGCNVWSPDGNRFACEGWDEVHPKRAAGLFSVRTSDFGGLVRLTRNPYGRSDTPGDYSPGGTRIAFPARATPSPGGSGSRVRRKERRQPHTTTHRVGSDRMLQGELVTEREKNPVQQRPRITAHGEAGRNPPAQDPDPAQGSLQRLHRRVVAEREANRFHPLPPTVRHLHDAA